MALSAAILEEAAAAAQTLKRVVNEAEPGMVTTPAGAEVPNVAKLIADANAMLGAAIEGATDDVMIARDQAVLAALSAGALLKPSRAALSDVELQARAIGSVVRFSSDELYSGKSTEVAVIDAGAGVRALGMTKVVDIDVAVDRTIYTGQAHLHRAPAPTYKRIYSRPAFSAAGNLVTNPDFSAGTVGWTPNNLTDAASNPLYSVVTHDGKTWLRLDQATATGNGQRGYMSQFVSLPADYTADPDCVLAVSFTVCGLFTDFTINSEHYDQIYSGIDPTKPERITVWHRPNGATNLTIKLNKCFPGQEAPGQFVDFAEVDVREATYSVKEIGGGLPRVGNNLQFARWAGAAWNEDYQRRFLAACARQGGFLRVWLSAECWASYTAKATPTKRGAPATPEDLSTAYKALTTAHVPTGVSTSNWYYFDWLFDACRELGLKMHVVLFSGFNDGDGNPHATLSKVGTVEFLDSDTDVQSGFAALAGTIVSRYRTYPNVVGWEPLNEGWLTWRGGYSGYSTAASYVKVRYASYAGYRTWERLVYSAIKAADPARPVILNTGMSDFAGNVLAQDDVCDWWCPSIYIGGIRFTGSGGFTGSPSTFTSDFGTSPRPVNDVALIAHAEPGSTLPSGLTEGQSYYVVQASGWTFKLSLTKGGAAIDAGGGAVGQWWFYSADGGALSFFDWHFQRHADHPKAVYFSEVGAPDFGTLKLYRDDAKNAAHLKEYAKRLAKFSVPSMLVFDEHHLMFDAATLQPTAAGSAAISAGANDFTAAALTALDSVIRRSRKEEGRVVQFEPGVIPLRVQYRQVSSFGAANGAGMGFYDFGLYDPAGAGADKFRVGARIVASAAANWGGSANYAPGKLSVCLQGNDGTDHLGTSVFDFDQAANKSLIPFWTPGASYLAPNICNNVRWWTDTSGFLRTKNGANPTSTTDGRAHGRGSTGYATDADYNVPDSYSFSVILFDVPITATRNVNLPSATSNRFNGDTVRVVRSPNCTGAFDVVVGSKTLAFSAGGTSVDVTYRSDTGVWFISAQSASLS